MIERLLFDVLSSGIELLRTTPGAITSFFVEEKIVSKEEAEKIEAFFLEDWNGRDQTDPKQSSVIHGYARVDHNKFPLIAITLGGENEAQKFLGDEGGFIGDADDENFGADEFAATFNYQFNLTVYAQHPDVVLYYYQLLKQMVINGFPTLKKAFLYDLSFSGADLAPDREYLNAGLFVRRATLSCSREYTQPLVSSKLGRAWKVRSIHIDAKGAPGESTGDVLTHVTFPEEEE